MPEIRHPRRLPVAAAVLLAHASLASAQPAATTELPVVTVTAKGYAAEEARTPASVVVIDRDQLFDRGASQVGDAVRGRPGLAVASDAPAGQNPVIRGLKRESIVLLVDGMRLNAAQPAGALATFMSLGLAERIEVVKGPASVLYGTGALGGVLNVQLPQARFDPTQWRATVRADSVDEGVRGAGVFNIGGAQHALMLGWAPARVDDYRAPTGTVARTGYDSDSVIGQYRWRPAAGQSLRLSAQHHEDRDLWFPGSARPGTPPALGTVTVHSPLQRRTLTEVGYSLQGSALDGDVRVYRQEVRRQIRAYSNAFARDQSATDVTFETTGADARATFAAGEAQLVTVGVNAWRMQASPERFLIQPPLSNIRVRNDPFRDGRIDALGVYVQGDARVGAANLLAGLRHDRVQGSAAWLNQGAITTGLARSDSEASGQLGVVFEVRPLLRPYAHLARGFRAGDMRERFEFSPRGDGFFYFGNPQIRPEIATQVEVGVKGDTRLLDYSLAVYRKRITDHITGRVTGAVHPTGLPIKQTENIGRVTIAGAEGEARWQWRRKQWLAAGFSVVRADNDTLGEPLFQSPADEVSVGWEGAVAAAWRADATLRLVRRQDRVATVFARGTENATAGFATADLGATWQRGAHRLRLAVRNVADKRYHEHLTEGVSGQEIAAPGRNFSLSWEGRF